MKNKTMTEVAHDTVKGLYNIGLVDKITMHEFDGLCLPKIKTLTPTEIKKLRAREKISQPILAMYLNVSPHTVKHWEQGSKHPTGAALKLLNLILQKGLVSMV